MRSLFFLLALGLAGSSLIAQTFPTPVNDIVTDRDATTSPALPQPHLRAADVMWQKRVWRVIDVREKINQTFAYPERPLISVLLEAAEAGDLQLYSTLSDDFSVPLTTEEREAIAGQPDTVIVVDPTTEIESMEIVERELNPAEFTRYRLQEIWYFDKTTSTQKVRILGIAPIRDIMGEDGTVRYEQVAFWVYYPGAREFLSKEIAYTAGNDAANRSWEDLLESRFFNGAVIKESNIHNRRLQEIHASGRDRLINGRRIDREIQARESDVWSY
ncbi:MAG: gliding motility protein GldN [Bacteroidota bacterium]